MDPSEKSRPKRKITGFSKNPRSLRILGARKKNVTTNAGSIPNWEASLSWNGAVGKLDDRPTLTKPSPQSSPVATGNTPICPRYRNSPPL